VSARRPLIGLWAAAALVAAVPATGLAAPAHCRTAGARVLDRDPTGVVFARGHAVYACLDRLGLSRRLPVRTGDDTGIPSKRIALGGDDGPPPLIAGGFAAYVVTASDPTSYGGGSQAAWVELYDIRHASLMRSVEATPVAFGSGTSAVRSLVLKRSGSVAWIVRSNQDPHIQPPSDSEVRAMPRRGPVTTLEKYTDTPYPPPPEEIVVTSLRLTPDRSAITWRHRDGRELSAPLR
jgi:hypothetical protein